MDFVQERDATYRMFLARVWSPVLGRVKGRGRFGPSPRLVPVLTGQVFWVVLADGIAGSPDGPSPAPPAVRGASPSPSFRPLSCTFFGPEVNVLDARTGRLIVG